MAEYISFQPSDFYNTKLFTGTGASNALTGVGFQPDFTWIKDRDSTYDHNLHSSVEGATKYLISNSTAAEGTNAEGLKSFDSDGFTLGTSLDVNKSSDDYASWNWKGGTTSGIDTTGSTITPSGYSFNATSGQSIIAYTGNGSAGALVPHGLGVAPRMIIVKCLSDANDCVVGHTSLASGWTKFLALNTTGAVLTGSTTAWNDTAPTAVNFSVGTNSQINENTNTYIAYCFAPVKGYSKFASYTGNGNTNGPFVYTGFRPACVIQKVTNITGSWYIYDNKREGYNPNNDYLYPDGTYVEGTADTMDLLSNGFKIDGTTDTSQNGSGNTYIYAAFAEFPLVSSNSKAGTAR